MKLSGEAVLTAPVADVYAALNDPAVLVRTIPGCQRLEMVGPDSYRATVLAGVASIKGTFDGEVRLSDQAPPNSFTLHASGAGAPGTVSAVARVSLSEGQAGGTLLRYDADATIGGVIGGVGQRMLAGVARKTAGEFFAAVDRTLAAPSAPLSAQAEAPGVAAAPPVAAGAPVASSAQPGAPVASSAQPSARELAERPSQVWHAPAPAVDPTRQRIRDLMVGAAFGAVIALLGVLVGAIVAGW
jgi:carbon monoxide dehydrogenase subunit G